MVGRLFDADLLSGKQLTDIRRSPRRDALPTTPSRALADRTPCHGGLLAKHRYRGPLLQRQGSRLCRGHDGLVKGHADTSRHPSTSWDRANRLPISVPAATR